MFRARPRGRRSVSRAPQRWRRRTVSGARPRRRWRTVFGTPVMMRRRRQRRDAGTAPSDRNAPPAIGLCQHDIDIAPIPARFLIPVVRRPVLRVSVTANGVVKNIRIGRTAVVDPPLHLPKAAVVAESVIKRIQWIAQPLAAAENLLVIILPARRRLGRLAELTAHAFPTRPQAMPLNPDDSLGKAHAAALKINVATAAPAHLP